MRRILPEKDYPLQRRAYKLLHSVAYRCRKKELPFDLDLEWILNKFNGKCEATGLSFYMDTQGKNYSTRHKLAPSIDRVDPNKGYTKDNCRMIIWWYNCAKQTFSDRELWHLCNLIVNSFDANGARTVRNKDGTIAKIT